MLHASKPRKTAHRIPSPKPTELTALAIAPVASGQGYDSLSGEGLSTAVEGRVENGGASTVVNYTVCTDMKKLSEALEINQSLSAGFGPFGSVSEKMQFVRKLDVTTYGISIVVYARHVMGTRTLTDVRLKDGIRPPRTDEEIRDFVHAYGDSYVSSVREGGEYYAVYTFYTQTREEQTSLTLDMKASGIFDAVKVDADLQTKLHNFVSETTTHVAFSQAISGIRNPVLPPAEYLITYALEFPSIPLDAPTVVGFHALGYEHVPKFGDFAKVAKNRNYFIGTSTDDGLTEKLVRVQQLLTQIGQIEATYKFYGGYFDGKLSEVRDVAMKDRKAIDAQMVEYKADAARSFTEPRLPSLKEGLPALSYSARQTESCGGGGGDPFRDVDPLVAVREHTRITGIQFRSGAVIDQIATTYENRHGTWTSNHGGGGGNLGEKLSLMPGEFIQDIECYSGDLVDSLKIALADGRFVAGGEKGGRVSEFRLLTAGAFFYGFSGRAGGSLDAIAFDFAILQPATWT